MVHKCSFRLLLLLKVNNAMKRSKKRTFYQRKLKFCCWIIISSSLIILLRRKFFSTWITLMLALPLVQYEGKLLLYLNNSVANFVNCQSLITVKSLLEPAVLFIFEAFQRPSLLSKSKKLTKAAGYNKGWALITILRYLFSVSYDKFYS